MSLRQKYVNILSGVLPAGALGVSLLLGATGSSTADTPPEGSQRLASDEDRVSERLAAVREAVSAVAGSDGGPEKAEKGKHQLAWGNWWGGWGYRPWGYYGWPNWPNWNNWHNWNNWNNSWRNW
jgi:hypothetical protein